MHTLNKNAANIVTIVNLLLGTAAIFSALHYRFSLACVLMIIGSFVDVLDGYIARKLNITSNFGSNLDALADIITFGVAPMLVLSVYYSHPFIYIASALLLICGAWRLARHNSTQSNHKKNYFTGVPIDMSAYLTSAIIILDINVMIAAISVLVLSILFISSLKIPRLLKH